MSERQNARVNVIAELIKRVEQLKAENLRLTEQLESFEVADVAKLEAEAEENWRIFENAARQRDKALSDLKTCREDSLLQARLAILSHMPSAAFDFADQTYSSAYQDGLKQALDTIDILRKQ